MTVFDALRYHMMKYRKMTPQDTVKLIYQSEFGGGHMISDREGARRYLLRELGDTEPSQDTPTTEPIGPTAARINLSALPDGLSPDTLFSMFYESSHLFSGTNAGFERKLALPLTLIEEKLAPFSAYDYNSYLERDVKEGGGAVHHSLP